MSDHKVICKCGDVLTRGADVFHPDDYAGEGGCFWNFEDDQGSCDHNRNVTRANIRVICKCGDVLVKGADVFHPDDHAGRGGCFWNIEDNEGNCDHNSTVTKADIVSPERIQLDY